MNVMIQPLPPTFKPKKGQYVTIQYFVKHDNQKRRNIYTGIVEYLSKGSHYLILKDEYHYYVFSNPNLIDEDQKEYNKLSMMFETLIQLHGLTEAAPVCYV